MATTNQSGVPEFELMALPSVSWRERTIFHTKYMKNFTRSMIPTQSEVSSRLYKCEFSSPPSVLRYVTTTQRCPRLFGHRPRPFGIVLMHQPEPHAACLWLSHFAAMLAFNRYREKGSAEHWLVLIETHDLIDLPAELRILTHTRDSNPQPHHIKSDDFVS